MDSEKLAQREVDEKVNKESYRSEFLRDLSRLKHSFSFRKLQGKTQLFPSHESDYFRNRLTHSIEVAQVAVSIAHWYNDNYSDSLPADNVICEFAGLAHDLGHPPFGHQGEYALNDCMAEYGGFEGNAQTLRLLTRLEKKYLVVDNDEIVRNGLNLTYKVLGSIIKYDKEITLFNDNLAKIRKGFYASESSVVKKVKDAYGLGEEDKLFSLECSIMDTADDICNAVYDLQDALRAKFINFNDILYPRADFADEILDNINESIGKGIYCEIPDFNEKVKFTEVSTIVKTTFLHLMPFMYKESKNSDNDPIGDAHFNRELYYILAKNINDDGYTRDYVSNVILKYLMSELEVYNPFRFPSVGLKFSAKIFMEYLKQITYQYQIQSPRLKIAEYRGKLIVKEIFEILYESKGILLPDDFKFLYDQCGEERDRKRVICDFIAGMTDRYAIEFYGRLKSEDPATIFRPL